MNLRDFIAYGEKHFGAYKFKSGRWLTAGKNVEYSVCESQDNHPQLHVYLYGHRIAVLTAAPERTTVMLTLDGWATKTTRRWHGRIIDALRRDGINVTWSERDYRMPAKLAVSGVGARKNQQFSAEIGTSVGFIFSTVAFCGTRFPLDARARYEVDFWTDGAVKARMVPDSGAVAGGVYFVRHRREWTSARRALTKYRRALMETTGLRAYRDLYVRLPGGDRHAVWYPASAGAVYTKMSKGVISVHDALIELGRQDGDFPVASELTLHTTVDLRDMTCPSVWADNVVNLADMYRRKSKSSEETQP